MEKKPQGVQRIPEHELVKFVLNYCDKLIFVLQDIQGDSNEIGAMSMRIFTPLMFGALKGWTKRDLQQIGTVWEYLNKAMPLGINGYPMFTSCYLMHKKDWEAAKVAIKAELERRKKTAENSVRKSLKTKKLIKSTDRL